MAILDFKKTQDGITKRLEEMISKQKTVKGFLNNVIYKQYQVAQSKRWESENTTQGPRWLGLKKEYAKRKLVRYAGQLGGGRVMLIATGRLYKSVIGPGNGQRKVTTDRSITIATTVPYASQVDAIRPFTKWSKNTKEEMKKLLVSYVKARGK